MKFYVMLLGWLCCAVATQAAHLHREKDYQTVFCRELGGETEYVLSDGTRVDCLTSEYAVEADFARKWAESVGQALYYAQQTSRRPGILLILEHADDERFLQRLRVLAETYQIRLWVMRPAQLKRPGTLVVPLFPALLPTTSK